MTIPDDILKTARELCEAHAIDCNRSTSPFFGDAEAIFAAALLAEREAATARERERCRLINPEPDIAGDEAVSGYDDGYVEGFFDAVARYRAAIDPSRKWWEVGSPDKDRGEEDNANPAG
jgi:hypothetical protein